jgi:hypothetical protein
MLLRRLVLVVAGTTLLASMIPARAATKHWASIAIASSAYGNSATLPLPPPFSVPGSLCLGTVVDGVFGLIPGGPPPPDLPRACSPVVGAKGVAGDDFSVTQATGAPDTYPACGDIGTAWEPTTSGPEPEILIALYSRPIVGAKSVNIYETNVGHFVKQVEVLFASAPPFTVYKKGNDPTTCGGVLTIPITTSLPVVGVVVHTKVLGWEEIDAVGVFN